MTFRETRIKISVCKKIGLFLWLFRRWYKISMKSYKIYLKSVSNDIKMLNWCCKNDLWTKTRKTEGEIPLCALNFPHWKSKSPFLLDYLTQTQIRDCYSSWQLCSVGWVCYWEWNNPLNEKLWTRKLATPKTLTGKY